MAKKVIYLPNSEQAAQLMENAWQDFTVQMKENGMNFEGTNMQICLDKKNLKN